jgi:hypothetical protein
MNLAAAMLAAALAWAASAAHAALRFDFGEVLQGRVVEHEFLLRNDSPDSLRISAIQLAPPLRLERMPAVIQPGAALPLRVSLDTSRLKGDYEGNVRVALADGGEREFTLQGRIVAAIEVLPLPAFFLSTQRGNGKSAELEIVNRDTSPLTLSIENAPAGLDLRLDAIDPGRRYRLGLRVPGDAPAGRRSERIELRTSSALRPTLSIAVNVLVRERVYTFPDSVELGTLREREAKKAAHAQTLMVYRSAGRGLTVEAASDVPGLRIQAQPGPHGDRVQLTISLADVKPGPVRGEIVLKTNDPDFRELRVPVSGEILAD